MSVPCFILSLPHFFAGIAWKCKSNIMSLTLPLLFFLFGFLSLPIPLLSMKFFPGLPQSCTDVFFWLL